MRTIEGGKYEYQSIVQPRFDVVEDAAHSDGRVTDVGVLCKPVLHRVSIIGGHQVFPRKLSKIFQRFFQSFNHQFGRSNHFFWIVDVEFGEKISQQFVFGASLCVLVVVDALVLDEVSVGSVDKGFEGEFESPNQFSS